MSGWNIMTRTDKGVVSLLKGLSEDEARGAAQRLHGDGSNPWGIRRMRMEALAKLDLPFDQKYPWLRGAGMEQIDCWGPGGVELEVWPKPADYDAQLQDALENERALAAAELTAMPDALSDEAKRLLQQIWRRGAVLIMDPDTNGRNVPHCDLYNAGLIERDTTDDEYRGSMNGERYQKWRPSAASLAMRP